MADKTMKKILRCEAQAGVTHYQVEINGQEQKAIAALADGAMEHDLTGLSDGTHKIRIRAGSQWSKDYVQWGPWSPMQDFFVFRPKVPQGVNASVKEV